jgi:hypothetical protein
MRSSRSFDKHRRGVAEPFDVTADLAREDEADAEDTRRGGALFRTGAALPWRETSIPNDGLACRR